MLSRTARCIHHQALSRTNTVSQRIMYRSMHLTCRIQTTVIRSHSFLKLTKYSPVLGSCTKRYASTEEVINTTEVVNTTAVPNMTEVINTNATLITDTNVTSGGNISENLTSKILDTIPEAPLPPAPTVAEIVSQVGEPSFQSLGLGSWYPPGIVQQCLEGLHVNLGLPWWEAIVIGTVIIRFALFPLVILAQRNGATMSNNMPEMTRLQAAMSEARQMGDQLRAARAAKELMEFMKEKKCNPIKTMIPPLAQAPIFLSVFLGLRKMADLPVESMKTGGLWWFTDLTVSDPYYLLPLLTAVTMAITIEIGTDSTRAQAMGMARYVLRALPVIIFPFTMHFPAGILCYWSASNFISLIQVGILRIPKCRDWFKIDALIQHPPAALANQKGFVAGFKSSIENVKKMREMNSRYEADHIQFHRAGRAPIIKTYSYDPTRQTSSRQKPSTVAAKKI